MDKEIRKISESLNKCLKTNDSEVLKDVVSTLEKSISEFFNKSHEDKDFFATFLNNSVLKPIANEISRLNKISLSSSRTKWIIKKNKDKVIDQLRELHSRIIKDYHKYLIGFSEYDTFIESQVKEKSKKRDAIISKTIISSLDFITLDYVKRLLDTSYSYSFNYFKRSFEYSNGGTEYFKEELYFFMKHLEETKVYLDKIILGKEGELRLMEQMETPEGMKDYVLEKGDIITTDLFDDYVSNIIELSDAVDSYKYQKFIIEQLEEKLYNSFLFLLDFKPVQKSPVTVFHNVKFEQLNSFCEGLMEFLGIHVSLEIIKEVFTVRFPIGDHKINLTNGNLNDFGYLMSKMRPYFIDSISNKSNYAQWWSERFTFNLKEKSKKNVSNMMSAVQNDGSRNSHKKQTIKNIIKNLDQIPQ